VIPDPKVRKDGLCAQCKGPRTHAVWNKYSHDAAILDPFCSTNCCRVYHGQPDLDKQGREQKGTMAKGMPGRGGMRHGTPAAYMLCACEVCVAAVKG